MKVVCYLTGGRDEATFLAAARRASDDVEPYPVRTGEDLVDLADMFGAGQVDQLVVCAHGGPTWLLSSRVGVTTGRAKRAGQVTVRELADAWAPKFTEGALISLAACLCSRSPRWWMISQLGRVLSGWGERGYDVGGQASFSARLRDQMWYHDLFVRVRGHRTAGHTTYNAILAEHRGWAGRPCVPLFRRAIPGTRPTRAVRRKWTRIVTGELAERWLFGDDSVVENIRSRWG